MGEKFPRAYSAKSSEILKSLASEEFASITLVHVTRSPIEVINSICRRIENTKLGVDYWKAIETIDQAIVEWKLAWNARKNIYPKIPFEKVIDLNYNHIVYDPLGSLQKIATILGVDSTFNHDIVCRDPNEWRLSQSQREKISTSFPSVMLREDWHKFGLFLDNHSFVFSPKT